MGVNLTGDCGGKSTIGPTEPVRLQELLCWGPCGEATSSNANVCGGKKEGQRSNYGLPLSSVGPQHLSNIYSSLAFPFAVRSRFVWLLSIRQFTQAIS